jgi:hypothetical protein
MAAARNPLWHHSNDRSAPPFVATKTASASNTPFAHPQMCFARQFLRYADPSVVDQSVVYLMLSTNIVSVSCNQHLIICNLQVNLTA